MVCLSIISQAVLQTLPHQGWHLRQPRLEKFKAKQAVSKVANGPNLSQQVLRGTF